MVRPSDLLVSFVFSISGKPRNCTNLRSVLCSLQIDRDAVKTTLEVFSDYLNNEALEMRVRYPATNGYKICCNVGFGDAMAEISDVRENLDDLCCH